MKIKLRDITKEQYKKWREDECNNCLECPLQHVICYMDLSDVWITHKDLYSDKFLDQEIEIEEKLLTDEEKQYLKAILKPFKERVLFIKKERVLKEKQEFVQITISGKFKETQYIELPYFDKGTMYKGLEVGEKYTLKELDLFKEEK